MTDKLRAIVEDRDYSQMPEVREKILAQALLDVREELAEATVFDNPNTKFAENLLSLIDTKLKEIE